MHAVIGFMYTYVKSSFVRSIFNTTCSLKYTTVLVVHSTSNDVNTVTFEFFVMIILKYLLF